MEDHIRKTVEYTKVFNHSAHILTTFPTFRNVHKAHVKEHRRINRVTSNSVNWIDDYTAAEKKWCTLTLEVVAQHIRIITVNRDRMYCMGEQPQFDMYVLHGHNALRHLLITHLQLKTHRSQSVITFREICTVSTKALPHNRLKHTNHLTSESTCLIEPCHLNTHTYLLHYLKSTHWD